MKIKIHLPAEFTSRKRAQKSRKTKHAFTLIEILFATAAFAIVLLVMKMTFSGAMGLRNKAHRLTEWENKVNLALNVMKKDLEGLTVKSTFAPELVIDPIGVAGSGNTQTSFYTTSGNISDDSPWGDIQKVFYSLEQAQGIFPTTSTTNQLGLALIRSTQKDVTLDPAVDQIDPNTQTILLENVESMSYEFFDGVTWIPSWDSNTSDPVMPEAVRVSLFLYDEDLDINERRIVKREILIPIYVRGPLLEESDEESELESQGGNTVSSNI